MNLCPLTARTELIPNFSILVLPAFNVLCSLSVQIVGYKSYAEFALKDNMASSPEVVLPFLLDMSKMVRPKAEEV